MEDCIFCKIVAGDIPAAKVYEDDHVLAFLDIAPVNPGHTLVIPKKHARMLIETDDEDVTRVMMLAKRVAAALVKADLADGTNVSFNSGKAAWQTEFHTHAHVVPRLEKDGFKPLKQGEYAEGEADRISADLQNTLTA